MRPRYLYLIGLVAVVGGSISAFLFDARAWLGVVVGIAFWGVAWLWVYVRDGNRMADLDEALNRCNSGEPKREPVSRNGRHG